MRCHRAASVSWLAVDVAVACSCQYAYSCRHTPFLHGSPFTFIPHSAPVAAPQPVSAAGGRGRLRRRALAVRGALPLPAVLVRLAHAAARRAAADIHRPRSGRYALGLIDLVCRVCLPPAQLDPVDSRIPSALTTRPHSVSLCDCSLCGPARAALQPGRGVRLGRHARPAGQRTRLPGVVPCSTSFFQSCLRRRSMASLSLPTLLWL